MPRIGTYGGKLVEFQSAPARESGRCLVGGARRELLAGFQSAPARESGRCRRQAPEPRATGCFNPRPLVRAGDAGRSARPAHRPSCFNPRPLVRAGDAPRHPTANGGCACFNPRPLVRAGDALRARKGFLTSSFQSAPARESGRCASFSRSRFEAAKSLGSANRVCQSMFEGSMEANGATSRKRINVLQNARTSAVRRTCCGFAQRIRLPAALRSRSIEIGRIA